VLLPACSLRTRSAVSASSSFAFLQGPRLPAAIAAPALLPLEQETKEGPKARGAGTSCVHRGLLASLLHSKKERVSTKSAWSHCASGGSTRTRAKI